jgi:hypothetical protein
MDPGGNPRPLLISSPEGRVFLFGRRTFVEKQHNRYIISMDLSTKIRDSLKGYLRFYRIGIPDATAHF